MINDCPFCLYSAEKENIINIKDNAYVKFDKYPINPGHLLIIPRIHKSNYFKLSPKYQKAMQNLMIKFKTFLDIHFKPDGFNIGINVGEYAGQTIKHVHMHLIPRYIGDVDNPTGGVRGVIPSKRIYDKG